MGTSSSASISPLRPKQTKEIQQQERPKKSIMNYGRRPAADMAPPPVAPFSKSEERRETLCLNLEYIAEYTVQQLNDDICASVSWEDRNRATIELLKYAGQIFLIFSEATSVIEIGVLPLYLTTVLRKLKVNRRTLNAITRDIVVDDMYTALCERCTYLSWESIQVLLISLCENILRYEQPFV